MHAKATLALAVLTAIGSAGSAGCFFKKKNHGGNTDEARGVVEAFVKPGADRAALFAALHPKDSDYAAVFVGDAADKAKAALEPLWDSSKGIDPAPDQTEVEVFVATPDELAKGEGASADCPAGYKNVADKLNPKISVYCFRFSKPGDQGGLAGDALVKVDDHWAYFPKVFRYLK
jgi:hypothetical protein